MLQSLSHICGPPVSKDSQVPLLLPKRLPRVGRGFVLLHVTSEMSSSVFPLTEKKSENPAASPGKKPSNFWLKPLYDFGKKRQGARSAGGVAQLCVKVIPLHWLYQSLN